MTNAVPQFEVGARDDLVEVRLLGLPLAEHLATAEHIDELRREFRLLEVQQDDDELDDVPHRLLRLMAELHDRFAPFTDETQKVYDEALERGEASVDVVYRVPVEARTVAETLTALLDEVDEYCRAGDTLLTLESPPEVRAYRTWYLGEFGRQVGGADPTPWPGS